MSRKPGRPPLQHTAVVGRVADMWSKLSWDIHMFREIQFTYPEEEQPLGFAAINVCIAASSLEDWAVVDLGRETSDEARRALIYAAVPGQRIARAIANTAKHSRVREWSEGQATLVYSESDEDAPGGYALRYEEGDQTSGLALNSFSDLREQWWRFLLSQGLVAEDDRIIAWEQNMLRRIFGRIEL